MFYTPWLRSLKRKSQRPQVGTAHARKILDVNNGVTASVSGLTIDNGVGSDGGGIYNGGDLTITSCTLAGNSANTGCGGGILIGYDLAVNGPGAGQLIIDGGHTGTTPGSRVFEVASGVSVTLSGMTIQHGYVDVGADLLVNGGGILTLSGCTLCGNDASFGGGGIDNNGQLTVSDSTFARNSAAVEGGGIANFGGLTTVSNSTFSDNCTGYGGGAIANVSDGQLTLINSTISGNTAVAGQPRLCQPRRLHGVADRNTANSSEASVVSTIKDDFEPFLESQQFRSPSLADSLDGLNWDEVNSDLDW